MRKIFAVYLFLISGVLFGQQPTAGFTISKEAICAGECIELTNTSSDDALSYEWTFPGGIPSTYSGQNPGPVCFNSSGLFTITLMATNTFGSTSANDDVTVGAIPEIQATLVDTLRDTLTAGPTPPDLVFWKPIEDTAICMFQQAYMWVKGYPDFGNLQVFPSGISSDSIPYFDYISSELNIDDDPNAAPDSLNGNILTVRPYYSTWYVFEYTANGCKTRDSLFVDVPCFNDSVKVTLPNSFSPNDDGENDYFRILTNVDIDNNFTNNKDGGSFFEGGAIVEVDFRIFDRYGHMVFRTTNPHEGWDGTSKGKPVNSATYTYILSYRRIDGRSDELKGNVTLFR
jgi:gliding motility-associated-like protein